MKRRRFVHGVAEEWNQRANWYMVQLVEAIVDQFFECEGMELFSQTCVEHGMQACAASCVL